MWHVFVVCSHVGTWLESSFRQTRGQNIGTKRVRKIRVWLNLYRSLVNQKNNLILAGSQSSAKYKSLFRVFVYFVHIYIFAFHPQSPTHLACEICSRIFATSTTFVLTICVTNHLILAVDPRHCHVPIFGLLSKAADIAGIDYR